MNKFGKTILVITLLCVCFACLFACKDSVSVTVTVKFNLDGKEDVTITVNSDETVYGKLANVQLPDCNYQFDGWFDSDGKQITAYTRFETDTTVYAQWSAQYVMQYYFQTDDGYVMDGKLTSIGLAKVGSAIDIVRKQAAGYVVDENNVNNVKSITVGSGDNTLKLYYNRQTVTVGFDKNLQSAVGSMSSLGVIYGHSVKLPQVGFASDFAFAGWNTAADGSGDSYADGAQLTLTQDVTLYAQWLNTYTEEIYCEQADGSFKLVKTFNDKTGLIGSIVLSQTYPPNNEAYYELDGSQGVTQGKLTEQTGLVLKTYFRYKTYTVTYRDDDTAGKVKYGQTLAVRTPQDETVVSYCTSQTGNGREYAFGQEIIVTEDINLYPVIVDIYTDNNGSGDRVYIRRNMTGLGSAKLIRGGTEYIGFVTVESNAVYFDVTVDADKSVRQPCKRVPLQSSNLSDLTEFDCV